MKLTVLFPFLMAGVLSLSGCHHDTDPDTASNAEGTEEEPTSAEGTEEEHPSVEPTGDETNTAVSRLAGNWAIDVASTSIEGLPPEEQARFEAARATMEREAQTIHFSPDGTRVIYMRGADYINTMAGSWSATATDEDTYAMVLDADTSVFHFENDDQLTMTTTTGGLVVSVTINRVADGALCTPGETVAQRTDCENSCTCADDGNSWTCTDVQCPPAEEEPSVRTEENMPMRP